jgi:hypothetical protein
MLLPSFKRIISSDFAKEYQKVIDQLSLSLNNGITVLYTALSNNLTIQENMRATVADVLVTTDATGKPTQTTAFKLNSTAKVNLVMVGLATNQANSNVYPVSAPWVSGVQADNIYTINNVSGLQAGQQYSLRIVAFQL